MRIASFGAAPVGNIATPGVRRLLQLGTLKLKLSLLMDGRMGKDSVSKKKFGAILYIEKIPRHTTDHKYYKMTLFFLA